MTEGDLSRKRGASAPPPVPPKRPNSAPQLTALDHPPAPDPSLRHEQSWCRFLAERFRATYSNALAAKTAVGVVKGRAQALERAEAELQGQLEQVRAKLGGERAALAQRQSELRALPTAYEAEAAKFHREVLVALQGEAAASPHDLELLARAWLGDVPASLRPANPCSQEHKKSWAEVPVDAAATWALANGARVRWRLCNGPDVRGAFQACWNYAVPQGPDLLRLGDEVASAYSARVRGRVFVLPGGLPAVQLALSLPETRGIHFLLDAVVVEAEEDGTLACLAWPHSPAGLQPPGRCLPLRLEPVEAGPRYLDMAQLEAAGPGRRAAACLATAKLQPQAKYFPAWDPESALWDGAQIERLAAAGYDGRLAHEACYVEGRIVSVRQALEADLATGAPKPKGPPEMLLVDGAGAHLWLPATKAMLTQQLVVRVGKEGVALFKEGALQQALFEQDEVGPEARALAWLRPACPRRTVANAAHCRCPQARGNPNVPFRPARCEVAHHWLFQTLEGAVRAARAYWGVGHGDEKTRLRQVTNPELFFGQFAEACVESAPSGPPAATAPAPPSPMDMPSPGGSPSEEEVSEHVVEKTEFVPAPRPLYQAMDGDPSRAWVPSERTQTRVCPQCKMMGAMGKNHAEPNHGRALPLSQEELAHWHASLLETDPERADSLVIIVNAAK